MHTTTIILDLSSAITRVEVTPSTLALTVGQSRQLTAVARNSAGNAVLVGPTDMLWSTTTAGVATVDASGRVCAVRLGIATIQATEQSSGRYATCAVTVSAAPHDAVLARATTELERVTTNPSLDPVTARAALSSAAADYTEVLNADPTHPQAKFGLAMARAYQGYLDMADMLPVPVKRWVGALDIPGMPSWAGLTPQGGAAAGPAQNRAIASTLPNLSAVLPNFDDVQLAVQNGADIRLRMAVGGSTRTVIFAVNDMQLAAAFGHCVKALLEFGTAYTLDMPGGTLMRATPHDTDGNGLLDAEEYLIPAPFLTCRDTAAMGRAIAALRQASIKAQRGTWLTDHTAGANALVDVADPTTKDGMLKLNKYAAAVSLACSAAVTSGEPFSDHKSRTIDLQKLTTITSLRTVFPSFPAAQPNDGGFWPDPTFAGTFRPGVPDDFIPLSYGDLRAAY
jgi:hypothetical protein